MFAERTGKGGLAVPGGTNKDQGSWALRSRVLFYVISWRWTVASVEARTKKYVECQSVRAGGRTKSSSEYPVVKSGQSAL